MFKWFSFIYNSFYPSQNEEKYISRDKFTGNQDIDLLILNQLPYNSLYNLCLTNTYMNHLCNKDNLLKNKYNEIISLVHHAFENSEGQGYTFTLAKPIKIYNNKFPINKPFVAYEQYEHRYTNVFDMCFENMKYVHDAKVVDVNGLRLQFQFEENSSKYYGLYIQMLILLPDKNTNPLHSINRLYFYNYDDMFRVIFNLYAYGFIELL